MTMLGLCKTVSPPKFLFFLWESQFLRECPELSIKYLAKASRRNLYVLSKSGVDWIAFKKINEMVQEVEIVGANHDLGPLCGYSVLDCNRHLHPPKALCMVIGLLNTELNYGLLETENHACSFSRRCIQTGRPAICAF